MVWVARAYSLGGVTSRSESGSLCFLYLSVSRIDNVVGVSMCVVSYKVNATCMKMIDKQTRDSRDDSLGLLSENVLSTFSPEG